MPFSRCVSGMIYQCANVIYGIVAIDHVLGAKPKLCIITTEAAVAAATKKTVTNILKTETNICVCVNVI